MPALLVVIEDLHDAFILQLPGPRSVVEDLRHDVSVGLVALQFQDDEVRIAVDGKKVDEQSRIGANLPTNHDLVGRSDVYIFIEDVL